MTLTEMTTPPTTATDSALSHLKAAKLAVGRRVADDELWQRLDQKLAEREKARKGESGCITRKSIFARIINGMGIRG